MREYSVQREGTITDKDIANIVITAFEGGISYWCNQAHAIERDDQGKFRNVTGDRYDEFMIDGCGPYANPEFWDNAKRGYKLFDEYEEQFCDHELTLSSLLKALQYQPPKRRGESNNWFRKLVNRIVDEEYDAADADVLVQIAVFGEVVYG
jgi:hypothetical protein